LYVYTTGAHIGMAEVPPPGHRRPALQQVEVDDIFNVRFGC